MGQSGIAIHASYPLENSPKTAQPRQIPDKGSFCDYSVDDLVETKL
jgi:hypothetical protein